jgi:hypothetical protein
MNENTIDTHLFIDIIVSEGAILIFHDVVSGETIEHYTARSGKRVIICTSDEYMTRPTATAYLGQLGLTDLIDRLFID